MDSCFWRNYAIARWNAQFVCSGAWNVVLKLVDRSEATHGYLVDATWIPRKKYLSTGELF